MTTTTNLGITLIDPSQAQKEVTANQAFVCLDAFLNSGAKSRQTNTPPGSPATGALYIVGSSPTGAWSGQAGKITYFNQAWQFITPNQGAVLWVNDEGLLYVYNGSAWVASGGGKSLENRIINGDFLIDQRNEGASTTPTASAFIMDMFRTTISQASKLAFQQVTSAPAPFKNALQVTVASAYTPISSDFFIIQHNIEGLNIADFDFGASSAQNVMLTFQVKSSVTGTYVVSLRNSAANRSYPATFSIPAANTWTAITLSIPGDTTGTWLTANGIGINLSFDLGFGSASQGTANTWQSGNYPSVAGAVQLVANASANYSIANVRLYGGNAVLPYSPRPFSQELALCQRYYLKSFSPGTAAAQNAGTADAAAIVSNAAAAFGGSMPFKATMRASPTITTYNPSAANANWRDTTNSADRTPTVAIIGQNSFVVTGASGAAGATNLIHYTADAGL